MRFVVKSLLIVYCLIFVTVSIARAELDLSIYAGPNVATLQDVKVRYFDLPGRQIWWKEHHVASAVQAGVGASLRYFPRKKVGVQGDFFYDNSPISANMEETRFGAFTMNQERYALTLSLVGRTSINTLGLSSLYATCGLGAIYANYTYIPDGWILGGQMSLGTDIASSRNSNIFIELKYLWHQDVGEHHQSPGQQLKTSGNPSWNMASILMGRHYDTQVIGIMIGTRFKLTQKSK